MIVGKEIGGVEKKSDWWEEQADGGGGQAVKKLFPFLAGKVNRWIILISNIVADEG